MWRAREAVVVRQWLTVRGPWFVVFVLGVLMATDTVSFGLRLHRSSSAERPSNPSPVVATPKIGRRNLQSIVAAHLFGRADTLPSSGVGAQEALKLMGIIATGQSHDGYAIIDAPDGVSHLYRVGSPIVAGLMLSEVFPDHVVLLRDETPVTLRLPKSATVTRASLAGSVVSPEIVAGAGGMDSSAPASFMPPLLPTSGAILRSLNLRPAIEHGDPMGMRVMATSAGERPLEALGLNPGDVVVSVNGAPVGAGPVGGELMTTINAGRTATLTVERQGRTIEITIDPASADVAADLYRSAAPP